MGFKPTHVSHKQVEAYPLERLEKRDDGRLIAIVRLGAYEGPIEVPANITARGEPQPGSMLVRYPPMEHEPDGYLAFSPRDAFDAGYSPIASEIEETARLCHEVNRAICVAFGHDVQPPWDKAPGWQRDSAINGVRFTLENPTAGPAAQHDAWCKAKVADGWSYGPEKDATARTHPCLVPYDELPPDQRVKDHTFRAVVATLLCVA